MAVSVSHAMRRHLAGPSEPPYINYSNPDSNSYTSGGLSQSMRYTETWLYGIPPTQTGLILPYPPSQPLVVLCACSGTKRSSKKSSPSVCKKCKGTKLPINNGTVRATTSNGTAVVLASSNMPKLSGTVRGMPSQISGTVRGISLDPSKYGGNRGYHTVRETGSNNVLFNSQNGINTKSTKLRPSIFDLENELDNSDPYDLMRRSRLVSPAEARPRTKSISPHRSSNRTRRRSPSPPIMTKHRSRSANRTSLTTDWIESDISNRRSILECDVNPYELMGKGGLRDSVDALNDDTDNATIPKNCDIQSHFYEDLDDHYPVIRRTRNYEPININKAIKLLSPSKELPKPVKIKKIKELPQRPPRNKSRSFSSSPMLCINEFESQSSNINNSTTSTITTSTANSTANNRFKSILKKTSTFSDTDSISDRIPSPIVQQVSGSHFYLPSPTLLQQQQQQSNAHSSSNSSNSTIRKKVQFLVENITPLACDKHLHYDEQEQESDEASTVIEDTSENIVRLNDKDETSTYDEKICNEKNSQDENRSSSEPEQMNQEQVIVTTNVDNSKIVCNDKTVVEANITTTQLPSTNSSLDMLKDVQTESLPKLRRSFSDRVTATENDQPPNSIQFNDTMALRRSRSPHPDHRDVFKALQRLDGVPVKQLSRVITPNANNDDLSPGQRPREPPPPPPPAPVAPVRKKSDRKKKTSLDSVTSSAESYHSCMSSSSDSYRSETETSSTMSEMKITESESEFSISDESVRKISLDVTSLDSESMPHTLISSSSITPTPTLLDKDLEFVPTISSSPQIDPENKSRSIIKIENSIEATSQTAQPANVTSVTLTTKNSENPYPKTTVVQISPMAVHRLKIKNEFVEESGTQNSQDFDNSAKKTSILITGDDCYSTVNVCDDFPVYQSSVVVNDSTNTTINTLDTSPIDSKPYGNVTTSTVYISCESDRYESINPTVPNTVISISNNNESAVPTVSQVKENGNLSSNEIDQLLKDPVEAVKRNLVPHVCGKTSLNRSASKRGSSSTNTEIGANVVAKLLKDPELGSLVEGLESDVVAKLLQESLLKLKQDRFGSEPKTDEKDSLCSDGESNVNSLNSGPYEQIDNLDDNDYSGSNRSSLTEDDLTSTSTRSKFYQLLADAALETDEHQYESIRINQDPIYEEIEIPPPLPLNPPPDTLPEIELDSGFTTRSIFEGASKYDILSYLVDARERGIESYAYSFANSGSVVIECENELETTTDELLKTNVEVERTDSGVGSESSKSSRSRYQQNSANNITTPENSNPCEDCNLAVDTQVSTGDVVYTPLVCRKCSKRRAERKEIITEIVETEEKYARDLQIILEEFYQPMLVAGLLNAEQLSAVFLNAEELLDNSQSFAERLRDALEIAIEQGDEDLLTVDIGRLFLDAAPMLHAFENYCVRQAAAGLLLANLEKEKELLRIFLKVSQMENAVLRRMNLNSFLMVPVQRVTKYPLLLARLNKVTPSHLEEMKELLTEAQRLVEQHLGQMNASAKDVPSRLWRRLSSGRRTTSELDSVNIKLRKLAVDVLEWNHDEARFAMEGKLLYTQPIDSAWRRGRTIKLTPVCALLVTLGRPGTGYKNPDEETLLAFPRQTGIREAALVLARDKGGRYSLLREPLYLDRCVVATDPAWQSYFEVQELMTKDTFIFKAEDDERTIAWYRSLQYHAQGMGAWRKRRNALANIMITGISGRT